LWGGQNTFLGEQDFCFHYMFEKNFYWAQKIGGGTVPECPSWLRACMSGYVTFAECLAFVKSLNAELQSIKFVQDFFAPFLRLPTIIS